MDHSLQKKTQEGYQVNINSPDNQNVLTKIFSQEASLKRRVRRNVKAPKAIAGLSFTELLAKKQQKPEVCTYLSCLVNDFAKIMNLDPSKAT